MNISLSTEDIANVATDHIFILAYILIGFGLMGMYRQWGFSGRYLFGLVFPLHWFLHCWIQMAWHDKQKFFLWPLLYGVAIVVIGIPVLCVIGFAAIYIGAGFNTGFSEEWWLGLVLMFYLFAGLGALANQ